MAEDQDQARPTIPPRPQGTPTSDECELVAEIERKRKVAESVHGALREGIEHRRRLDEISAAMPPLTSEQWAALDAENDRVAKQRDFFARDDRWKAFIRDRGERYADCRLENFVPPDDSAQRVVSSLTEYRADVEERVRGGEGLLLFGPKGTGKDHLVVAIARMAIYRGLHVVWQNGMDLFGDMRDRIDADAAERAFVHRLIAPDVLYLSDPLSPLPLSKLTDFQASLVFRILDGRYSRRRPTWCTVNVASGTELESRLGAQNADRLKEDAWAFYCAWPSHRKVAN